MKNMLTTSLFVDYSVIVNYNVNIDYNVDFSLLTITSLAAFLRQLYGYIF